MAARATKIRHLSHSDCEGAESVITERPAQLGSFRYDHYEMVRMSRYTVFGGFKPVIHTISNLYFNSVEFRNVQM